MIVMGVNVVGLKLRSKLREITFEDEGLTAPRQKSTKATGEDI